MLDNCYTSLVNQEEPINSSTYNNYTTTVVAPAASEFDTVVIYIEDPGHFDQCEALVNELQCNKWSGQVDNFLISALIWQRINNLCLPKSMTLFLTVLSTPVPIYSHKFTEF